MSKAETNIDKLLKPANTNNINSNLKLYVIALLRSINYFYFENLTL